MRASILDVKICFKSNKASVLSSQLSTGPTFARIHSLWHLNDITRYDTLQDCIKHSYYLTLLHIFTLKLIRDLLHALPSYVYCYTICLLGNLMQTYPQIELHHWYMYFCTHISRHFVTNFANITSYKLPRNHNSPHPNNTNPLHPKLSSSIYHSHIAPLINSSTNNITPSKPYSNIYHRLHTINSA